jgi:hypothetical protein
MAKKTTLDELGKMIAHVVEHMATKDDLKNLATKDQLVALHTQVNSIETQLRDMRHTQLQSRVADLEENVFGKARR